MPHRTTDPDQAVTIVVKIGGSLLDLPDLSDRLVARLNRFPTQQLILVVGGGAAADLVRRLDRSGMLEPEQAHWLGVRAMTFNSYLVEGILPDSQVVCSLSECRAVWKAGKLPIQEPQAFLRDEENSGRPPLPHSWAVTSDSIAARVARAANARELVLWKSVSWDQCQNLDGAARDGIVDEFFPHEVRQSNGLRVRIENLRTCQ